MSKKALLEAVLFLSGTAMTERQLAETTGLRRRSVRRLLTVLVAEYEARDGGLEVARRGRRWVLQAREAYARRAAPQAPKTLPASVLKTAGLIAYYQPVKQSHLVHVLGSKAYDHVKRLRERGLIAARPEGRTLLLTTTSKFLEFFGLSVGSRKELRRLLAERVEVPEGALQEEASAST